MSANRFELWADQEIKKGLKDIKFAIMSGKGIHVEAVQEELLAAEALIAQGAIRVNKPHATSMIPDHIQSIISSTR